MHRFQDAVMAGYALKAETPVLAGDRGSEQQTLNTDKADFATGKAPALGKRFATLAARAALVRCVLRATDHGFVVTRTAWGLSRSLQTLTEVESLLHLMEGER